MLSIGRFTFEPRGITRKKTQFLGVLQTIVSNNIILFNPLELVKWNCTKDYLLDLTKNNIKVIDSLILSRNKLAQLNTFILKTESDEYVVKPLISGGGDRTFRAKTKKYYNSVTT